MKVLVGEVVSNFDEANMGSLTVKTNENPNYIRVIYVTPYSSKQYGGFIAIPEVGSKILITKPDNDDNWFYLGTAIEPSNFPYDDPAKIPNNIRKPPIPDDEIYKARNVPQRIVIQSPKGAALVLSDSYNKEYFNVKAELKSSLGKKIMLIDGGILPEKQLDAIIIRNEHGDHIKLTTNSDAMTGSRCIELDSMGSQMFVSRGGEIDLLVHDGQELNIKNASTGSKRSVGPQSLRYGNVNIESKNKDINLVVRETNGRVFIDALGANGLIQIDSTGRVLINAENGEVQISASTNIDIVADGNINMRAGGTINMIGQGGVNADGSEIHLNSGRSSSPSPINKETNVYGD